MLKPFLIVISLICACGSSSEMLETTRDAVTDPACTNDDWGTRGVCEMGEIVVEAGSDFWTGGTVFREESAPSGGGGGIVPAPKGSAPTPDSDAPTPAELEDAYDCIQESINNILEEDGFWLVGVYLRIMHQQGRIHWGHDFSDDNPAIAHIHLQDATPWDPSVSNPEDFDFGSVHIHLNPAFVTETCVSPRAEHDLQVRDHFDTLLIHEALHHMAWVSHKRDQNGELAVDDRGRPVFDEIWKVSTEYNCKDQWGLPE